MCRLRNDRLLTWIGSQLHIYPWLININGKSSYNQPVWMGDVAATIRKYCMTPDAFAGKTIKLAGPEVISWADLKTVVRSTKLHRTPTTLARWFAFLLEVGTKPYLSRSEMELRVTDTILDLNTECIVFKDLGIAPHNWESKR
ncbi:uncharacterized protein [Blastocystis hominis]|uniref:Uncharacterized protein n=1 Tax=Blastocystis hominis TaxID=12968 RepID=D8M556_BLAHO|nr:uncharacterized protein [Blastocystis hominis]CBK23207.2 unnamed protein product [Blastocystis hominis]|eukprot:XP_012897255.1 uncharacterized protein [Blastocystis hominis]